MKPETLLAHSSFLRSLAHSLVEDETAADDVVQQTWLAALEHLPERVGSARAWLAAVARNAARRVGRVDHRRRARESAVARPEALPSVEEILCRQEAARRIVQEVFDLEEPYRTTVMLRFYDDLPPREIARRMDVPVETVRTRLKRALAKLRARLDMELGGDRSLWSWALLPLAKRSSLFGLTGSASAGLAIPKLMGVFLMSSTVKSSLGVLLVLAALVGAWQVFDVTSFSAEEAARHERTSDVPPVIEAELEQGAAPATGSDLGEAATSAPSDEVAAPAKPADGHRLSLEVAWDDGTAGAGIELDVYSHGSGEWQRIARAVTDDTGACALDDVPEGQLLITCERAERDHEAFVRAGAENRKRIVLSRGFTVEGVVVDDFRRPVAGAEVWTCSKHAKPYAAPIVATSGRDGRFSVENLKKDHRLGARARGYTPSWSHPLEAGAPGGTLTLELVLSGPGGSLSGRIFDAEGQALEGAEILVGPEQFTKNKSLPDGTVLFAPPGRLGRSDDQGRFLLEGLKPHSVASVQVRAEGHAAWTDHLAITAGEQTDVEIHLDRSPVVTGRVTDAHGRPIAGCNVLWIAQNGGSLFLQTGVRTHADGTYRLEGLGVGSVRLFTLTHPFEQSLEVETQPGQVIEWNPVVRKSTTIRGRLIDGDGEPIIGWPVRTPSTFARSGDDGRFTIATPSEEPTFVQVYRELHLFPIVVVDDIIPGPDEIEIRIPDDAFPSSFIAGRVLEPDGDPASSTTITVAYMFSGRAAKPSGLRPISQNDHSVDPEGRFHIGPLPPATYRVSFRSPGHATIELELELEASQVHDVGTLRHSSPAHLGVVASTQEGEPVRRGWIELLSPGQEHPVRLEKEGERWYSGPLSPGAHQLRIRARGFATHNQSIELTAGEDREVAVALAPGVACRVEIWLPESPEAAAIEDPDEQHVFLLRQFTKHHVRARILDDRGALVEELRGVEAGKTDGSLPLPATLAPGRYTVEVTTESGLQATGELVLTSPERPVTVRLVVR